MKLKYVGLFVALVVISAGAFIYCSSGSKETDDEFNNVSDEFNNVSDLRTGIKQFTGPGSFWDVSLNYDNKTFELKLGNDIASDPFLTVSGEFQDLPTGYLKLIVSESSNPDFVAPDDVAYALEVPGFALFVKPLIDEESTEDEFIIPLVITGTCPTATFTANWLVARSQDVLDATASDAAWFGTFKANIDGAQKWQASLPTEYALSADYPSVSRDVEFPATTCDKGIIEIFEGSDPENLEKTANIWMTSFGGAMAEIIEDGRTSDATLIALPRKKMVLTDLAGRWSGILLQREEVTVGMTTYKPLRLAPAKVIINDNGSSGIAQIYSNIETGTVESEEVDVSFSEVNQPSDGFVTGQVSHNSDSGNLVCAVSTKVAGGGHSLVFCNGQDPSNNVQPFSVILVRQVLSPTNS